MNSKVIVSILTVGLLLTIGIAVIRFGGCSSTFIETSMQERDSRSNITFELSIKVLDQDGKPLQGVRIDARVHTFSDNWAGRGGARGIVSNHHVTTGVDGISILSDRGSDVFIDSVEKDGYRWLKDLDSSGKETIPFGAGTILTLSVVGNTGPYLPDKSRPAVFIMVHDGVHKVRVAPSPGGYLAPQRYGGSITPIKPQWPRKPSIPGVRFVPSSQPSTVP